VHAGVRAERSHPDEPQEDLRGSVEHVDRRRDDEVERVQRPRHVAADLLGAQEGGRFRGQLAQHDVEERDARERDRDGRGVRGDGRPRSREIDEGVLDHVRERRFADPAQAERGEGDPELGARNRAIEVREGLLDLEGQPVSLFHELVDPRAAYGNQRELGRYEEAVGEHQRDDREQVQRRGHRRGLDLRKGSSSF
jgi:hypothetical protein